jgi:hypothetical protein
MQLAPYLLQAFAARMLASKSNETVALADLQKQGYDVETLLEMIEAYNGLTEAQRGFVVTVDATHLSIRRKSNGHIPQPPLLVPPKSIPVVPVATAPVKPPALARAITSGLSPSRTAR